MARQDRLVADVDRGFNSLEQGEIEEAEKALERCTKIDRHNPDVVALAAALADAKGEVDTALEKYSELAQLRPDDPMPRVCLARIQLHDVGDADTALETIEKAFDFIDEEDDLVEAIVVRTEALLATDDVDGARESLAELSTSVIEDPHLALDLGELALAADDTSTAIKWTEIAKGDDATKPEAYHLLGRIHEARDERAEMIAAWKQVLAIDAKAAPGPVTMSEDEIERIASETLAELPDDVRKKLESVPILIDDLPSEDLIEDGLDPRLLGVFNGPAMPDVGNAAAVTNIMLFKKNLERIAHDLDELAEEVRITVLHETAHYFGLDEEDLEKLGLD
ncbi:MAG TPA: metallopeptidase family protein [Kofleriaceae bacterium]|jgi:predicted Zn-dependent protease with MMP-like domain/predicted Zn-dependent protease|nr:metallopeptidase family protein [Kofleriaceae bacterium]